MKGSAPGFCWPLLERELWLQHWPTCSGWCNAASLCLFDLRLGGTLDYLTSIVLGGERFDLTFVKTGGLENSIKCEFWVIASRWMCGTSKHAGCKCTKIRWALLSVPKCFLFDRTHRHMNIISSRHIDIKNKLKEKERRKNKQQQKTFKHTRLVQLWFMQLIMWSCFSDILTVLCNVDLSLKWLLSHWKVPSNPIWQNVTMV